MVQHLTNEHTNAAADAVHVLPLASAADVSHKAVGGKAAALGALIRAGFAVPPGEVLPTRAFDHFLQLHKLGSDATPADILGATLPQDTAAELDALCHRLGSVPLAVRSSAVGEDAADASFAGQFDTVLNVEGPAALKDAVLRCWASAFSDRVRTYTSHLGQSGPPAMAVVIQRMIPAQVAGVVFTADPVTGDQGTIRLSAVRGTGERLVSGEASPDEWVIDLDGPRQITRLENALTAEQVRAIVEVACEVAWHFGTPQDIEWALVDGQIHVLQSRPITGLPSKPELPIPASGAWMKDKVHYPELVTPFGASVYLPTLEAGIARAAAEFGMLVEGVDQRYIGGEIYGRPAPVGGKEGAPPPWWLIAILARVVPPMRARMKAARRAIRAGLLDDLPRRWEQEWRDEYRSEAEGFLAQDLAALDDAALRAHLDSAIELLWRGQRLHFRLFLPYVVRLHELMATCQQLLGWDLLETLDLVAGLSDASSEPSRELGNLAHAVRESAAARKVIERPDAEVRLRLAEADPAVAEAFDAYMMRYGQRSTGYDPGAPTLAERPAVLAGLLHDALAAGDPLDGAAQAARRRTEAEERANTALVGRTERERNRFAEVLQGARATYGLREDNIFWTDNMPCGLIRRALVEIGTRLASRGTLASPQDAAFLHIDEVRAALDGALEADVQHRVSARRAEHDWVLDHPGPAILGDTPAPPPDMRGLPTEARRVNAAFTWLMGLEYAPPAERDAGVIGGIGASAGRYTGTVRIIRSEAEFERLQPGDVLVCPITTPTWSVLFQSAGALVTDGGSILSHAAIVAREHDIPAVVGTERATHDLVDGQRVTVDGTRGTVETTQIAASGTDHAH